MTSAAPPAATVQPRRALASSPCVRTLPLSGVAEGDAAPEAFVAPVVADDLVCDVCDDDEAAALVFEREAELSVCPKEKPSQSWLPCCHETNAPARRGRLRRDLGRGARTRAGDAVITERELRRPRGAEHVAAHEVGMLVKHDVAPGSGVETVRWRLRFLPVPSGRNAKTWTEERHVNACSVIPRVVR